MELVELGSLSERDWAHLIDGEHEPWGAEGAGLAWREKDRHFAWRERDGRLIAVVGAVIATVEIESVGDIEVVGVGSLIVTRSRRGGGLMSSLVDAVLRLAEGLGPDRAMLFCRPQLAAVYRRLGFGEITAPVWADQPGGRIEMPLVAMWRALHAGAAWPSGRVDVRGLPF